MKPDEILSYEVLCGAYDTDNLPMVQRYVRDAERHLLDEKSRTIATIPNVGYRILRAVEHTTVARRHEQRSRKNMEKALVVISATRLNELDPVQREQVVQQQFLLKQMCYAIADHEDRLNEHNGLISKLQREQDELRAQVDFLKTNESE